MTVLAKADETHEKKNKVVGAVAKTMDTTDVEDIKLISEYVNPLLVNGVASKGDCSLMHSLDKQGLDWDLADYRGRSPLHIACISGNHTAVEFLINQKVHINKMDMAGKSALYYAAMMRHEVIVDLLLTNGAII